MQGLSAEGRQRGAGLRPQLIRLALEARAVDVVAQERMSDRGEMDADFGGCVRFEPAGEQARHRRTIGAEVALEHLPMGDRSAAARAHRHLVAGARVPVDRLVDGAAGRLGTPQTKAR